MRFFIGFGIAVLSLAPFAYGQQGSVDAEEEPRPTAQKESAGSRVKLKTAGAKQLDTPQKVTAGDKEEITILASAEQTRKESRDKYFKKGTLVKRVALTPVKMAHRLKNRGPIARLAKWKKARLKFLKKKDPEKFYKWLKAQQSR